MLLETGAGNNRQPGCAHHPTLALEWHIVGWRSTVVALVDLLPTGGIFSEVDGSGVEEEGCAPVYRKVRELFAGVTGD